MIPFIIATLLSPNSSWRLPITDKWQLEKVFQHKWASFDTDRYIRHNTTRLPNEPFRWLNLQLQRVMSFIYRHFQLLIIFKINDRKSHIFPWRAIKILKIMIWSFFPRFVLASHSYSSTTDRKCDLARIDAIY